MQNNIELLNDDQLTEVDGSGICWAGVGAAFAGVCAGTAIACASVASCGAVPAAVGLIYLASIACSAGATYEGCQ